MEMLGVIFREFSQGLHCVEKATVGKSYFSVDLEGVFLGLLEKRSENEFLKNKFFN